MKAGQHPNAAFNNLHGAVEFFLDAIRREDWKTVEEGMLDLASGLFYVWEQEDSLAGAVKYVVRHLKAGVPASLDGSGRDLMVE